MLYNQLLKAERKGYLCDPVNKKLKIKDSFIQNAVPFVLDISTLIEADMDEISSSKSAMQEMDLWKIPFDKVSIEIILPVNYEGFIKFKDNISRNVDMVFVVDRDFRIRSYIRPQNRIWGINALSPKTAIEFQNKVLDVFLVLLATRGVKKQLYIHNTPINLPIGRKIPDIAYTKIYIDTKEQEEKINQQQRKNNSPRQKTRLHLRRGHIRNQRFGANLSEVKKIWIAPVLVGYEEEGLIVQERIVR